ncbi:hypothetical protein RRG08_035606 [Elysia crispata]|uniref:Uncharacterized protein n=1 Tax=Elysia crispata TaxID=231223 RepID=A0AAE1B7B4_9GAST|nr:hypothetical protein RRG08_035606 [Elysia crispata]
MAGKLSSKTTARDLPKTSERTTRAQAALNQMSAEKQRAYWREKQRAKRANMSEEERQKVKARARELYAEKSKTINTSNKEIQTNHHSISDIAPLLNGSALDASVSPVTVDLDTAFVQEPSADKIDISAADSEELTPQCHDNRTSPTT